jgi:hypothetical protein
MSRLNGCLSFSWWSLGDSNPHRTISYIGIFPVRRKPECIYQSRNFSCEKA